MYEKLIEQLREYPDREETAGGYVEVDWQDLLDAADALESLTAQLAALQSENVEQRTALSRVEAERDAVKRTLDGICSQIDNDCWLRKQFCENGDNDLEPCLCPSLREHSGYIDSDDCEGCDFFVNSWRGAQGEG